MSTTYDLLYRGVSKENNIRYLTANTPPADDNSNKVPTTEWVKEKMDDVEAAVSGGMNATVKKITGTTAPSGGTWYCYGTANLEYKYDTSQKSTSTINSTFSGGAALYNNSGSYMIKSSNGFGIKIA